MGLRGEVDDGNAVSKRLFLWASSLSTLYIVGRGAQWREYSVALMLAVQSARRSRRRVLVDGGSFKIR